MIYTTKDRTDSPAPLVNEDRKSYGERLAKFFCLTVADSVSFDWGSDYEWIVTIRPDGSIRQGLAHTWGPNPRMK